jgi:sigma-B regulation protein RsbU (phosphoserine phosphatase)
MEPRSHSMVNPWRYVESFIKWKLSLLNTGANMIGALIVTLYFLYFDEIGPIPQAGKTIIVVIIMCFGLVCLGAVIMGRWEADLVRFAKLKQQNREVPEALYQRVQRKTLNLPSVCTANSLISWVIASAVMATYRLIDPTQVTTWARTVFDAFRVFVGVMIAGLITSALVYFTLDMVCRRVWPFFFPQGGLIQTRGVFRLKLQYRSLIIFLLASAVPIVLMAVLSYNKARLMLEMNPAAVIQSLLYLTAFLLAITLAMTVLLSRAFSSSIVRPISRLESAMTKVAQGDFSATVPVSSNDELGVLADHFNRMAEGLAERYQMRRALDLAKEVQQNLLPKQAPRVEGIDIAGTSIYCDETGGDYFDYLLPDAKVGQGLGIVIGDVAGHGVPSALLMAEARALLRQRFTPAGSLAEAVSDVNRQITKDIEDTGRFITLFFLWIAPADGRLRWVRAGHEPALLYDPAADRFEELQGRGIALGINQEWQYMEYERSGLSEGQIIVLATDGVWEARNPRGDMFGKSRIREIIRSQRASGAAKILAQIVDQAMAFKQHGKAADDVTLVVVKLTPSPAASGGGQFAR